MLTKANPFSAKSINKIWAATVTLEEAIKAFPDQDPEHVKAAYNAAIKNTTKTSTDGVGTGNSEEVSKPERKSGNRGSVAGKAPGDTGATAPAAPEGEA